MDPAVAPASVVPRQAEDQLLDLGRGGWATTCVLAAESPLAADQLAVPLQDGLRLEQQEHLVQGGAWARGDPGQLGREHRQGQLLPAGEAWWLGSLTLKQPELVAQQQDLDVL